MKKRLFVVLPVLTLLIIGGILVDRARAAKQSLVSGYFESQPTLAASRIGGRVSKILVKEGQEVHKGDRLVLFETESYAATVAAQKAAEAQAQEQYREVLKGPRVEQIERARAGVREAQAAYGKLIRGARPEEIAIARNQFQQANAQYLELARGSRPEEVRAAQAGANVALARLRAAERGLTAEEKAQLQARLDSASADENLAKKELDRIRFLVEQGAVPQRQLDAADAAYKQAQSRRRDAGEALQRAQKGTPPEELAQVREGYRQALAQLSLVRNGARREDVQAARDAMEAAKANLNLVQQGPREEDIAAAKARLDQAQAALTELETGSRPEEIAKARAARDQAALQAKSVQSNLKEREVVAPVDGTIERILVADGDLVATGASVVQISASSDIWLRVYVPESALSQIKAGDSAELRVDGVAGSLAATVDSVSSKGEFTPANLQSPEERGKQVFAIRLRLTKPDRQVKAGMYATVVKVGSWQP